MEIKAILAVTGEANRAVIVPIEGNNALLRPMIQLSNAFEQNRRSQGARLMICERYIEGQIKGEHGVMLIEPKTAIFEHSSGHPPRLVLHKDERNLVIDNPIQYMQAVDIIDGGCLYCGCDSRANCAMCSRTLVQAAAGTVPA